MMGPQPRHRLGHGVLVVRAFDGGWQIRSERLHMPWTTRTGRVTGSAVIWLDEPYEVFAVSRTASGERWDLRPWPQNEVMRGVFPLGQDSVEAMHDEQYLGRVRAARWWLTVPFLPILGLLPGKMQATWERDWGFPAATATLLSAVAELAVAALGVTHLLVQGIGGVRVLPPSLSWLGLVSPVLFIESIVRLKHFGAHREPIGSAAGLPFSLFGRAKPVPAKPAIPEVRRLEAATGILELWSPIHRSDWTRDGVLRFRDEPYQMVALERSGTGWLYRFSAVEDGVHDDPLRFAPEIVNRRHEDPARSEGRRENRFGVFSTAVLTALVCMAPGDLQSRWAGRIQVRPQLLTVVGAGAELAGGVVNLGGSTGAGWWVIPDVFFVVEGGLRLAVLILTGRPVGSLIGLALRPLLEKWMPNGWSG